MQIDFFVTIYSILFVVWIYSYSISTVWKRLYSYVIVLNLFWINSKIYHPSTTLFQRILNNSTFTLCFFCTTTVSFVAISVVVVLPFDDYSGILVSLFLQRWVLFLDKSTVSPNTLYVNYVIFLSAELWPTCKQLWPTSDSISIAVECQPFTTKFLAR